MAVSGGNQYSAVNLSSDGGRAIYFSLQGRTALSALLSSPSSLLRRPLLPGERKENWKLRMEFDFHRQDRRVERGAPETVWGYSRKRSYLSLESPSNMALTLESTEFRYIA